MTTQRPATWDLRRQISYTETIRKNLIVKHEAKLADYDEKLEDLKTRLAEAEAAEASK